MERIHRICLLLAALWLPWAGCKKECLDEIPTAETVLQTPDGYQLSVLHDPITLVLSDADGVELTRSVALRFGAVDELDDEYNYDPYLFYQEDFPDAVWGPVGLEWVDALRVTGETDEGEGALFAVELEQDLTAELWVEPHSEGIFVLEWRGLQGAAAAYTVVRFDAPPEDGYYGTGERFDAVEHSGTIRAMQFEMVPRMAAVNNEAHVPVPLLVSSAGWGLFAEDPHPMIFDIGASDESVLSVELGHTQLRFALMGSADPLSIVEQYTTLTAQPKMPPRWAFAPIQWRNEVTGQEMILQDAVDCRAAQVPTGAIWVDRPWQGHYMSFIHDEGMFPDPAEMVDTLHEQGFRYAAWSAPYLEEEDPEYATAEAGGYFAGGAGPYVFQDFGKLMDLSHPDAQAMWQERVAMALDDGIEGWKLDYAEDVQLGLGEFRLDFQFANGEDERTMHHRYSLYYHQAYSEPLGEEAFILGRTGTYGGQQWCSVIWPGDLCSDFRFFGDDDGEVIHVGGLPSALRAGVGLAASGYPLFASDIGGFRHNRPTSEVLVRWAEMAALLPIMQYGGGGSNHNPWDFEDQGEYTYDEQTLELFRRYADLHIQLFPYFYALTLQAHETGYPVIQAWGLAFPDDGRHPQDAFLSGEALLVAPLDHGGDSRSVPIPPGEWVDWWTGESVTGPQDLEVSAPLGTLPLYQRAGSIVPMIREGVQTLSPVSDPGVDSYDEEPGRVWGRAVPLDSAGTVLFALHDGGQLALSTNSSSSGAQGPVSLQFELGDEMAGLRLMVHRPGGGGALHSGGGPLEEAATLQDLDSCDACWFREDGSPWLWVAVDPSQGDVDLTME